MGRLLVTRSGAASRRSALLLGLAGLSSLLLDPGAPAKAGSGLEGPDSSSGRGRAPRGDDGPGEGVAGRVVGRNGAPISGAMVVPSPAGGGAGPVPEMAVLTNADGSFQWSLGRGRYRIDVVSGGRTIASVPVTVARSKMTRVRITARAR